MAPRDGRLKSSPLAADTASVGSVAVRARLGASKAITSSPARGTESHPARVARLREAPMLFILLGALLVIGGVVYMARAAISRDRMSDPRPNPNDTAQPTLEPRHRGLGFLGLKANWPGLLMIAFGFLLLLAPLV